MKQTVKKIIWIAGCLAISYASHDVSTVSEAITHLENSQHEATNFGEEPVISTDITSNHNNRGDKLVDQEECPFSYKNYENYYDD